MYNEEISTGVELFFVNTDSSIPECTNKSVVEKQPAYKLLRRLLIFNNI